FWDILRFPDGSIGVAVADVAGKGLAASLIMASVKSALPLLGFADGIAGIMATLNRKLHAELGKREFVAIALLRYDPGTGEAELANAGLPDPYLVSTTGVEPVVVGGPRLPVGMRADLNYETVKFSLREGESVVMLTDGLPEALAGGEPLGYDRLAAILAETARDGVDAILGGVNAVATADDDQTVVALSRVGRMQ
ncbi:MAG: PP2C family protein-serine/threonine phosphatase, partial [Thermoanaerobaculia bacterium]